MAIMSASKKLENRSGRPLTLILVYKELFVGGELTRDTAIRPLISPECLPPMIHALKYRSIAYPLSSGHLGLRQAFISRGVAQSYD